MSELYDLFVIGGGVNGTGIARDAAAPAVTGSIDRTFYGGVWMPDGRSLAIVAPDGDRTSIWHQPISGRPRKLELGSLSQEHGIVRGRIPSELGIGSRLRVIANHSCLAAAMHDRFHVVRGDEVVDEWRPIKGW